MRVMSGPAAGALLLVLASTMTTACLTTERPAVQDTARLVAGALTMPASGEWQNGDEHLTFVATLVDSLTEVVELVTFGTDGTARRTLRFDARGALRTFDETRSQTAQVSDRTPTRMQVALALRFAGDSVVQRDKQVDGVAAPVRDYEITNARAHAAALLERFATPRTPPSPRN